MLFNLDSSHLRHDKSGLRRVGIIHKSLSDKDIH